MEIKLKEKRILNKQHKDFSWCLVLYSADGVSMYQYALLSDNMPDDILTQVCKSWAGRNKKKQNVIE